MRTASSFKYFRRNIFPPVPKSPIVTPPLRKNWTQDSKWSLIEESIFNIVDLHRMRFCTFCISYVFLHSISFKDIKLQLRIHSLRAIKTQLDKFLGDSQIFAVCKKMIWWSLTKPVCNVWFYFHKQLSQF